MSEPSAEPTREQMGRAHVLLIELTITLTETARSSLGGDWTTNRSLQVLALIDRQPGVNPSALSERIGCSRSSLSQTLRRLQRTGLVERTHSVQDLRRVGLRVSPSGRARMAVMNAAVAAALQSLPVTELIACLGEPASSASREMQPFDPIEVLGAAGARFTAAVNARLAEYGVTTATQRFVLGVLSAQGASRPVQLAAQLRITSAGLSLVLDELEARKLIVRSREANPADRRATLVQLTPLGHVVAETVLDVLALHAADLCTALLLASQALAEINAS